MGDNSLQRIVVIVEDDDASRKALGRLLTAAGFVTALFESAEAFIAAERPSPMCLLIDVHLPGMSGLDLQNRLRDRGSTTPVIVMTANNDVAIRNRAAENGSLAFLHKPFDSQRLIVTLRAIASGETITA
jgi:two-component system response regulator FixJ